MIAVAWPNFVMPQADRMEARPSDATRMPHIEVSRGHRYERVLARNGEVMDSGSEDSYGRRTKGRLGQGVRMR